MLTKINSENIFFIFAQNFFNVTFKDLAMLYFQFLKFFILQKIVAKSNFTFSIFPSSKKFIQKLFYEF
jgi:hypothetical protein